MMGQIKRKNKFMAILRVFQSIENDIWKLTFVNDPDELSDTDRKKMKQFGEPEIEVGGVYLESDPNEFTLPTRSIKIRADLPYVQTFDSKSEPFDANTQIKVEAYRDEIVDRFTTALTTLRSTADTFSGEKTYTI
jgi:hypothetical protein